MGGRAATSGGFRLPARPESLPSAAPQFGTLRRTRVMAANSDIHISVSDQAGRQTASSGSKWEPKMGYSRAVRSGNIIAVTGTVGVNADGTYPATLAEQTRR